MTPTKNESLPELPAKWLARLPVGAKDDDYSQGYEDALRHAASDLQTALTREAPTEGDEKPVAWWNGIQEDKLERSPYGPSIRWGADAENDGHDIPLYAGMNPVHYATPPAPQRMAQGARPSNCRMALRDAGKAYPRSGCAACGDGGLRGCPYERTAQPPHHDRGEVERDRLAYALNNMKGFFKRDSEQWDALDKAAAALTEAKQQDDDGWEANFRYLLERSPHTLRSREGGGPDNLLQSAILTFTRMEQLLAAKQQGTGEAESPSLKQTPAWWVGYSIGHTGRAPYHCIGPDEPPSHYMRDSVHWTPLYTAPQVEAKRQTGGGE